MQNQNNWFEWALEQQRTKTNRAEKEPFTKMCLTLEVCCERLIRCIIAIIVLPFVLVLTILAFIVWLILLPRK